MDEKKTAVSMVADGAVEETAYVCSREEAMGFRGEFNEGFRRLLLHRREECGLTIGQICSILGVDNSTYRKWEDGSVARCRSCNIRPLRRFMLGELGEAKKGMLQVLPERIAPRFSALAEHFKSLLTILSLLDGHPELEERLVRGFEAYCEDSRLQLAEALFNEQRRRR